MSKISIALCTYNGSKYLRPQLDSFISQIRQPDEVIICDDRSSDRTLEIIDEFSRKAPFSVNCFVNDNNLGAIKNFEKAIVLCTGHLIALSDQDDVWHPEKLKQCENILENRSDIGAVFSNAEVVDESLNPLGYDMWQKANFTRKEQLSVINGKAIAVLLKHYIVTGATMIFRADFKPGILPIPSFWFHDAWIALLTASISKIAFISEPMMKYRQHSDNQLGGVKKTFVSQISEAFQIDRNDYYKLEILRYCSALDRLLNISNSFNLSVDLILLEEKIKHLQSRSSMHKNRLLRIPAIINELIQLRYYRYSRNWGSVAMDLFFR
jgi:glycosyltransferase involved in cell wall biosynthesis